MRNRLEKIERAFNKQKAYWSFFAKCERAYNAVYDESEFSKRRKAPHALERSRLYVPLIKTTCDIIHSIFKTSFLSSGCPIEVRRIGMREEHDQILQNALNLLVKKHWQDKSHKVGLSRAVLSAIYLPLGVLQLYYENGAIRTKHIPIVDIAFDIEASDISDVDYVAYMWRQSKVDLKNKFESGFYTHPEPERIINADIGRIKTKEIYERCYENGKNVWILHTFIAEEKVREAKFDRLPFHFGYCLEAMPPVLRNTEMYVKDDLYLGVYGSCLPARVGEIQAEYNIKRNQKIDLVERIIDPQFIICANKGSVDVNDIYQNKKIIKVETAQGEQVSSLVMPLHPVNSSMSISEEIGVIKDEYERATGVNSIMTGQTSPSDRRAMGALQVVNASSSMRIEAMLQTLADTMLNGYARDFVEILYQNTSDEELIALTENPHIIEVIGTQALRATKRLDFDIKTNFGTTIGAEMEVSQLNNLLAVMAQCGLNDPRLSAPLLKDIMLLMRGENAPIEQIDEAFGAIVAQQEAQEQAQLAQQQAQAMSAQAGAQQAQAQADPSVIEAQMMEQAAQVAAANEAERQNALANAIYAGGL